MVKLELNGVDIYVVAQWELDSVYMRESFTLKTGEAVCGIETRGKLYQAAGLINEIDFAVPLEYQKSVAYGECNGLVVWHYPDGRTGVPLKDSKVIAMLRDAIDIALRKHANDLYGVGRGWRK